jgi:hypothetical protein
VDLPNDNALEDYVRKFAGAGLLDQKGKVIVIVHFNGYVGFGVDDKKQIADPFVIKFDNSSDYVLTDPDSAKSPDIGTLMSYVDDYLKTRAAYDVADARDGNSNNYNENKFMDTLYDEAQDEVELSGMNDTFANSGVVQVNGSPGKDYSQSILLFKSQSSFEKLDCQSNRNKICILPDLDGAQKGYKVYVIDENGNVSGPTYIYAE